MEVGDIDIIGFVHWPEVLSALAEIGGMRAGLTAGVRAGVEHVFAVRHKKSAGGTALSCADHRRFHSRFFDRFFDGHGEYLVTLEAPGFVVALKAQPFSVEAPVGLCVIAAEGELADIFEMRFLNRRFFRGGRCGLGITGRHAGEQRAGQGD